MYWRGDRLWNFTVEQDSQIKDAWNDATGYLEEFLMDMSVKYRLLYTTILIGGTYRGTVPAIAVFSYHVGKSDTYGWSLPILQALKGGEWLWVYSW